MGNDPGWGYVKAGLVGAVVAAVLLMSFPVVAAVGDALTLGKPNSADAVTYLNGAANTNLQVTNTKAGAPALTLRVASGAAPMKVNSATRVASLNADLLDGQHAAAFLPVGGTAADSALLDGRDSTQFVRARATTTVTETTGSGGEHLAVLTLTISAPTAGYLIIGASIDVDLVGTGLFDVVLCFAAVDGGTVAGSSRVSALDDMLARNAEEDCSTDAAEWVGAGSHTVMFVAGDFLGTVDYSEGTLWTVWVPFSGPGDGAPAANANAGRALTVDEMFAEWREGRESPEERGPRAN